MGHLLDMVPFLNRKKGKQAQSPVETQVPIAIESLPEKVPQKKKSRLFLGIMIGMALTVFGVYAISSKGPMAPQVNVAPTNNFPVVAGGKGGKARVMVINIVGPIFGMADAEPSSDNTVRYVKDAIRLIQAEEKDGKVAMVLLRVDSPGGGASASDQIYRYLAQFRRETKVPFIAYIHQGAYSGGYWAVLGASEIYADRAASAGNIGVISSGKNYSRLWSRLGIEEHILATGPQKAVGHEGKLPTADDDAMEKRSMDVQFGHFIDAITESRHIPRADLVAESQKLLGRTSGAWFIAEDAVKNQLIDDVWNVEQFEQHVAERLKKENKDYASAEMVLISSNISVLETIKESADSARKKAPEGDLKDLIRTIIDDPAQYIRLQKQ